MAAAPAAMVRSGSGAEVESQACERAIGGGVSDRRRRE